VRRSGDPLETFTLIAERALDVGGNPVLDAQGNPTYTGYFVDPTDSSIRFASVLDAQNAGFSRDLSGLHIGNFRLSDEVMESEYNIAASTKQIIRNGDPDDLQSGNNLNMNQLVLLFGRNNLFLEGADERIAFGSFDDFATRIRQAVASTTHVSRHSAETSRNLTHSAENQRLSIGGVSLDEEMTHMIRFNHAYNGAARVITAMDDALDRLINGTGRVGL
jgi:flagellar hook-associated protein 1 FlgK